MRPVEIGKCLRPLLLSLGRISSHADSFFAESNAEFLLWKNCENCVERPG
jgi:hypothetical protein